jgi:transcriptional regulator of acetoin/glycerol metabolism
VGAAPSPVETLPAWSAARDAFVETFERDFLTGVLAAEKGVVSAAARRAGLERSHFQRLLRQHRVK